MCEVAYDELDTVHAINVIDVGWVVRKSWIRLWDIFRPDRVSEIPERTQFLFDMTAGPEADRVVASAADYIARKAYDCGLDENSLRTMLKAVYKEMADATKRDVTRQALMAGGNDPDERPRRWGRKETDPNEEQPGSPASQQHFDPETDYDWRHYRRQAMQNRLRDNLSGYGTWVKRGPKAMQWIPVESARWANVPKGTVPIQEVGMQVTSEFLADPAGKVDACDSTTWAALPALSCPPEDDQDDGYWSEDSQSNAWKWCPRKKGS